MIKILHFIPSLRIGGAEKSLINLVRTTKEKNIFQSIIVLTDVDPHYRNILNKEKIKVYELEMKNFIHFIKGIIKIKNIVKATKPRIIQTWLYKADLIGLLIKMLLPRIHLIWNVRCSYLNINNTKFTTLLLIRFLSFFSKFPSIIITNSEDGMIAHKKKGYKNKWKIIYNGFDTELFKPSIKFRNACRKKIQVENYFVIGYVGKFEKIKGISYLLEIFEKLLTKHSKIILVMIGNGFSINNKSFLSFLENYNIPIKKIRLLNVQNNVFEWMNAFDLFLFPSESEGFPNVIGEAMSSSIPCVCSNSGSSKVMLKKIGYTNSVSKIKNFENDCSKIINMNKAKYNLLKKKYRKRIINNFSQSKMNTSYAKIYAGLINNDYE